MTEEYILSVQKATYEELHFRKDQMKTTALALKTWVMHDARKIVEEIKPAETAIERACLYHAGATILALRKRKIKKCILQAGSVSWPRLRPDQDDGKPTTFSHFRYQYEGLTAKNIIALTNGNMPEMHVWAARTDTLEIIDLTTGFQEKQCLELIKTDWPGDKLPKSFWGQAHEIPEGWRYTPNEECTVNAMNLFVNVTGIDLFPEFKLPRGVIRL